MLPYGLAIAVGLSSLILFLTAFLMPKIHRQDDFIWSGLGLFYALVLWFCASQLTTALLLGQIAIVILLVSYTWQVIKLRKAIVSPSNQSNLSGFSVTSLVGGFLNRTPKVADSQTEKDEKVEAVKKAEEVEELKDEDNVGEVQEVASVEKIAEVPTEKKSGLFNKFRNVGKKEQAKTSESQPSITNTKLDALLDKDIEEEPKSEEITAELTEPIADENQETKINPTEKVEVEEVIVEEEPEEETNWDFLDEEPEIIATEEIKNVDPENSSSEQETNSEN